MRNLFIKKTYLGFVGLLTALTLIVLPFNTNSVDADGGNNNVYLPVIVHNPVSTTSGTGTQFYVSTNGSSSGDGSMSDPWSLQHALDQPSGVKPGATIWVRGGTYQDTFVSHLKGASGAEINVRAYPGERATIDLRTNSDKGLLISDSYYVNIWDLEITNSAVKRNTSDQPGGGDGIGIASNHNSHHIKFINLVVHDLSAMGFAFWSPNADSGNLRLFDLLQWWQ